MYVQMLNYCSTQCTLGSTGITVKSDVSLFSRPGLGHSQWILTRSLPTRRVPSGNAPWGINGHTSDAHCKHRRMRIATTTQSQSRFLSLPVELHHQIYDLELLVTELFLHGTLPQYPLVCLLPHSKVIIHDPYSVPHHTRSMCRTSSSRDRSPRRCSPPLPPHHIRFGAANLLVHLGDPVDREVRHLWLFIWLKQTRCRQPEGREEARAFFLRRIHRGCNICASRSFSFTRTVWLLYKLKLAGALVRMFYRCGRATDTTPLGWHFKAAPSIRKRRQWISTSVMFVEPQALIHTRNNISEAAVITCVHGFLRHMDGYVVAEGRSCGHCVRNHPFLCYIACSGERWLRWLRIYPHCIILNALFLSPSDTSLNPPPLNARGVAAPRYPDPPVLQNNLRLAARLQPRKGGVQGRAQPHAGPTSNDRRVNGWL